MVIVMDYDAGDSQVDAVRERIETAGVRTSLLHTAAGKFIRVIDDGSTHLAEVAAAQPGVKAVNRWRGPYHLAARDLAARQPRTLVRIGDGPRAVVGGRELAVVAGPCAVEDRESLLQTAWQVQRAGAGALRGGAFKPRTSPYAFQGLGLEGLRLLAEARRETGLPVVTEVLDTRHVDVVAEFADVLQVGARNMQNYALLAELGRLRRPVLLKRGFAAELTELLLAAEYILARGNDDVILCERGIRAFAGSSRNTLDLAAIPVLKSETHLPVLVDPSHAAGQADLVTALAYAGVAAGADGLIVEVHARPGAARSDGVQALAPQAFEDLMIGLGPFAAAAGRTLAGARSVSREAAA